MSDSAHDGDQAIPIMEKLHSGFGRELLPFFHWLGAGSRGEPFDRDRI
jgi:hypothetical protein